MAVCGYQTSNGNEHVIFIGADNHVYELVRKNGEWLPYTDLTKQTHAPNAAAKSALAGYQTSNGYEHINYIAEVKGVSHVQELIYTDQWKHNDLTASANTLKAGSAPGVFPGSALAAYQTSNGYEHVFFIAESSQLEKDSLIHELIYANGHWACNEISQKHKAGPYSTALTGFETSNGSEHVFYISTFVHELIYTDKWKDNDLHLHVVGGQAEPLETISLAGLKTSNGNEHVFYIGPGDYVRELIYTNDAWFDNAIGGVVTSPATALAAYQTSNGNEHVNYIDNKTSAKNLLDCHVHELIYTDQWKDNDLTKAANTHKAESAPPADATKGIAGYKTSNGNEHVNYMDEKFQVHELIYANGHWACNNLSTATGVPGVAEMSVAAD
jgi:hypothetical protein